MTTPGLVTIFVRVFSDNPTASVEAVADALVNELGLPDGDVAFTAMLAQVAFGRALLHDIDVDVALSEHYVLSDPDSRDIRLVKLSDSEVYRELERHAEERPDLKNAIGGTSNEVQAIEEARRKGVTPRRMGPPIVFERGECTEAGHARVVAWVQRTMAQSSSK